MTHQYLHSCLAFAPHPDDAELWCGGLLAKLASLGHSTAIVDLTGGEMGTQGSLEQRRIELNEAAKVLGLAHRENLTIPDCGIPALSNPHELQSPTRKIVSALRRLKPELVLIPAGDGRHPDHDATPSLLRQALFLASLPKYTSYQGEAPHSPRQVLIYPMRRELTASFIVDVSEHFAKKMLAVRCYRSQIEPANPTQSTLIGSKLNLPSLEAHNRHYGAMIGVEFGEPYVATTMLAVEDPVALFRTMKGGALFFPKSA